jgi:hypothetical protein
MGFCSEIPSSLVDSLARERISRAGDFPILLGAKTIPQLLNMSWAHFAGVILQLPLIAMVWVLVSTMQRWQLTRFRADAVGVT